MYRDFDAFLPCSTLSRELPIAQERLSFCEVAHCNFECRRWQVPQGAKSVNPYQTSASTIHNVYIPIGGLGYGWIEILFVGRHIVEQHIALGLGHVPEGCIASVFE